MFCTKPSPEVRPNAFPIKQDEIMKKFLSTSPYANHLCPKYTQHPI